MARKSLRPHLNQIRTWVRQGRTDAWVAHQLEVSVREIEQFKRQNELVGEDESADGASGADFPEEIDLRAEDDALIAAELEAAEAEAERAREEALGEEGEEGEEEDSEEPAARARRSRRGGRGRRSARNTAPLEGTFDHGEEGYGLWLDPAIQDNPIYAEHWAGPQARGGRRRGGPDRHPPRRRGRLPRRDRPRRRARAARPRSRRPRAGSARKRRPRRSPASHAHGSSGAVFIATCRHQRCPPRRALPVRLW